MLDARFSPQGSFVAWSESAPEPTNNRIWLIARQTPCGATMVFEDVTDWRFATNW